MMLIQKAVKQNKKKHLWFNKISESRKKFYYWYSEEISTWHVKVVEAPQQYHLFWYSNSLFIDGL